MAAVTGQEELAKLLAELEDLSEAQTPAEPGLVVLPFGPTG